MRKNLFSILIAGIICLTATFTSCQSDETEFAPTSKIELLKAKSKEFAKKYNVNVTLNDDSIAKYADQMTVESMEEDYKAFAEMKKAMQTEMPTKQVAQAKPLSRKAFLKRRKSETETILTPLKDQNGEFRDATVTEFRCRGKRCGNDAFLEFVGEYHWSFNSRTRSITCNASISTVCNHKYCEGYRCSGCTPNNTEHIGLTVIGTNFDNDINFTAQGSFYCNVCAYSALIGVKVNFAKGQGAVSFQ